MGVEKAGDGWWLGSSMLQILPHHTLSRSIAEDVPGTQDFRDWFTQQQIQTLLGLSGLVIAIRFKHVEHSFYGLAAFKGSGPNGGCKHSVRSYAMAVPVWRPSFGRGS